MRISYKKTNVNYKFDECNHLVGFNNGVYDLNTREFRKGTTEEFVFTTTKYDYEEPDQKYVTELKQLVKSIFPDKKERKYIMTIFSFGVTGETHFQEFYMLLGYGGNGKSLLTLLTKCAIGPVYCKSWKPDIIKEKGNMNANEKSQVYAGASKARMVFITECHFKNADEIDYHNLKAVSGGEEISCKMLYSHQTEYIPKFNMCLVTNAKIPMNVVDNSMIRRARNCPFRVTFVKKADLDKKNKYMALSKPGLEKKIKQDIKYHIAFFFVLCNYYFKFVDNNFILDIPETIKTENTNFNAKNNTIKSFFDDCIDITINHNDRITISMVMQIIKLYDDTFNIVAAKLTEAIIAFSHDKVEIKKLNGYQTCKFVKFKSKNQLKNHLNKETIELLINNKLVK
jgi:phage/plasmid-associated DNA primase